MSKRKEENIVGKRIGLYDVLYESDFKSNDGHRMFHVKCSECGWETDIQLRHIKFLNQICKHQNSAGQYTTDKAKLKWSNRRIYRIYQGILQRCYNPNEKSYCWYGAKGIKVCQEWLDNPLSFEKWAILNGYEDNLTIDRIDESKDYSPNNCRWIALSDNAKFKSTTRILEVDGIEHTGREWPKFLKLGTNTVNLMLRTYPEEQVKEFIRRRLQDLTKIRKSHQTWMNVYGLE